MIHNFNKRQLDYMLQLNSHSHSSKRRKSLVTLPNRPTRVPVGVWAPPSPESRVRIAHGPFSHFAPVRSNLEKIPIASTASAAARGRRGGGPLPCRAADIGVRGEFFFFLFWGSLVFVLLSSACIFGICRQAAEPRVCACELVARLLREVVYSTTSLLPSWLR